MRKIHGVKILKFSLPSGLLDWCYVWACLPHCWNDICVVDWSGIDVFLQFQLAYAFPVSLCLLLQWWLWGLRCGTVWGQNIVPHLVGIRQHVWQKKTSWWRKVEYQLSGLMEMLRPIGRKMLERWDQFMLDKDPTLVFYADLSDAYLLTELFHVPLR